MKVFPIKAPLDGEQVVGVTPKISRFTEPDWRRRLNHFSGRALTHTDLRSEQAGRSGHAAAIGEMLSPGVIKGLVAEKSNDAGGAQFLEISAGQGIDANGEILRLNAPLRVLLDQIRVYAPIALLEGDVDAGEPGAELVRTIGPDLKSATETVSDLPPAAILVLQPVQVEMKLDAADDPCEPDAEDYAYEDWQLIDGARLLLYCWPQEIIGLPTQSSAADWRNRLANAIFEYENNLAAGEAPSWTRLGVPLAVIGFDKDWQALFVDRHAAVRSGGKRRRSTSILSAIGNRFLWQARFDQFNEHLVDSINAIALDGEVDIEAARQFRYLPPVGVLPNSFVDLETRKQQFFPLSYHVEALAVPYEQLDIIVQESASLAAFDFNRADRVQALVPVPQSYYEPGILDTELLDPEFDATIQGFVEDRNDWLGRRLEIRRKGSLLNRVITGTGIDFAALDSNAVDIAELAAPFERAPLEYRANGYLLKGDSAPPADWNSTAFDDSAWSSVSGSLGYGLAAVQNELDDMAGNYVSVFVRKHFDVDGVDAEKRYRLEVLTNGGFIAYLNGTKISSHNLSAATHDAVADQELDASVRQYDLSSLAEAIVDGDNLLAVQAHAASRSGGGFVFTARLVEIAYHADIEADDYGIVVSTNDSGEPKLNDAVPDYRVTEMTALREFFESLTYDDPKDGNKPKSIWQQAEIDKFNAIESDGLEPFIDYLQDKVNKANDKVDFGFVRMQTDIYRLRQFMLGNEEATKLATSPALASIARGQTAVATREDIARVASILSSQAKAKLANGNDDPEDNTDEKSEAAPAARNQTFFAGSFENLQMANFVSGPAPNTGSGKGGFDLGKDTTPPLTAFSSGQLYGTQTPGIQEIEQQAGIVGSYDSFKNVTVGERLQQSIAKEAVDAGRANRLENIVNIQQTELSMEGIFVPGFKVDGEDAPLAFGEISPAVLQGIIKGDHEGPVEANEASRFNSSVLNLERSTTLLRLVEGRVKSYRTMIGRCKKSLGVLYATRTGLDKRLKIIEDELAEGRHDVSVSRALKAEEQERIDAINLRRKTILAEQVPFLVFRRPRLSEVLLDAPMFALNPDRSRTPLPVCDIDEDETPEEISAMMEVVRESPIKWFELSDRVMLQFNRLPDIQAVIAAAKSRAAVNTGQHRLFTQSYSGLNRLALGLNMALKASQNRVVVQRRQVAAFDLSGFARYGWQESRQRAAKVISLGDVLDGNHGRMGASKLAAEELDQISRVSVCLYLKLAQTLPSIRLDWAERLSQYDAPFNLRNLYSLPRWGEIDFIERSDMQRLADWLYARFDNRYSDAADLVNELIRVCILLASHAPVNQIISGLIEEPVQVNVGSTIDIVADLTRIRIGMNVAMVSGSNTLARGRVSDIVGGRVQAQIVSTASTRVLLEKNARVQIGEPRATGGKGYAPARFLLQRR
jgi:hypothetical protein